MKAGFLNHQQCLKLQEGPSSFSLKHFWWIPRTSRTTWPNPPSSWHMSTTDPQRKKPMSMYYVLHIVMCMTLLWTCCQGNLSGARWAPTSITAISWLITPLIGVISPKNPLMFGPRGPSCVAYPHPGTSPKAKQFFPMAVQVKQPFFQSNDLESSNWNCQIIWKKSSQYQWNLY